MRYEIGKQISFAAPADIYGYVTKRAADNHRTVSQEMRLIMAEYLTLKTSDIEKVSR
jgi:hypothetical protein